MDPVLGNGALLTSLHGLTLIPGVEIIEISTLAVTRLATTTRILEVAVTIAWEVSPADPHLRRADQKSLIERNRCLTQSTRP